MANPVALDLSAAKTLFAFGERAAKHGLAIPGDLQQFIDEPDKMSRLVDYAKAGAPFYKPALPDIPWLETYKVLGLEDEFRTGVKTLVILDDRPGLWVMPVIRGVTSNKIVAGHRKLGINFYLYALYADDLDNAVPTHDRNPNRDGSYVIGFRRTIEADEENANKSADQLAQANHRGITLAERLLLGAGFYIATSQHLDVKTATLCSGSRYSDGYVPIVDWRPDRREVDVYWYHPGDSSDGLRSRSAVS